MTFEFRHYDPKRLVPIFKEMGYTSNFTYRVCHGCVFTHVPPEDCIHGSEYFHETSFQSDCFCEHCSITIEDSEERFYLSEDKDLSQKVRELEQIIEMASLII